MAIFLFVAILAVALSFFDYKKGSNGLKSAFILITAFMGLRYMFGTDYITYMDLFTQYNEDGIPLWDISGMRHSDIYGEVGWQILNKLFKPFGFFGMIIVLSILENVTIYKLIKRNVPSGWYWLAIVIYMFNTRFFLIGACSMLRQWLAVCLIIIAVKYIEQKRFISYALLVLLAGSFHNSAFFMLPFYFLCYIKNLNFKVFHFVLLMGLLFAWRIIVPYVFEPLSMAFLGEESVFSDFARYREIESDSENYSLFGLISEGLLYYFVPFIGLLYYNQLDRRGQVLVLINVFSLFIKPFASIVPMIGRMDYYFIVFSICLVPLLFSMWKFKKPYMVIVAVSLMVLIYIRQIHVFLTDSVWMHRYLFYKTIFMVPWM